MIPPYLRRILKSPDTFFKSSIPSAIALCVCCLCFWACGSEPDADLTKDESIDVLNTVCSVTGFPDTVTGNSLHTVTYQWEKLPEMQKEKPLMAKVHFVNSDDRILFQDDHRLPVNKKTYQRELLIPLIPRSQRVRMLAGLFIPQSNVKLAVNNADGHTGTKVEVASFVVTPPLHIDDLPEARISYGPGWHQKEFGEGPNDAWRWMSKQAQCTLKGADRELILYMHGWTPSDKLGDSIDLELTLDGEPLGMYQDLDGEFIIKRVIPDDMLADGDSGELVITASKSFVPSELEDTDDTRELSIMVKQLYFN